MGAALQARRGVRWAAAAVIAAGLTVGPGAGGGTACCAETGAAPARQGASTAAAQPLADGTADLRTALDALAALPGEPRIVSAAGVTRDETPLLTLENPPPFAGARPGRRMVRVGGLDGDPVAAARIVLDAARWVKAEASEEEQTRWTVSAFPMAHRSPAYPYLDHAVEPHLLVARVENQVAGLPRRRARRVPSETNVAPLRRPSGAGPVPAPWGSRERGRVAVADAPSACAQQGRGDGAGHASDPEPRGLHFLDESSTVDRRRVLRRLPESA